MDESDVKPSEVHFGIVIGAWHREGNSGKVLMNVRQMETRGLKPDQRTYACALMASALDLALAAALRGIGQT